MSKEWYSAWQTYFTQHDRIAWWVELVATRLASVSVLVPLVLVWFPQGRLYMAWAGIHLVVGWLILVQLVAYAFPQQRPYQRFGFVPVRGKGLFSQVDDRFDSFPSGHTTALCILAFSAAAFSTWLWVVLALVAVSAGMARVFLGWHFVRDICGGVVLALAVVSMGTYFGVFDFLQRFMV